MNKRCVGKQKEELAAEFLIGRGVKIIDKNFACKVGEIDLICLDKGCLVFVEVKYRKNTSYGYPQEAVTKNKRRKIILVSGYYRMLKHYGDNTTMRFDVISILNDEIIWDKNAFGYDDI